ncbi:hypothetical protein CCACVL1_08312 [Corchorus capsularis]|uniref:C2H2-type domain-containing protein n=1 Tax=Corchorus capsularis TaxID=210143 RepID=A0A1R3J192_COCAP|nr:hypothetical protein CCACVL1_08312 [Corchorus capsularis]
MAAIWFSSLKRSLKLCKAELSDIVQPNPNCNDEPRKPVLSRLLSSKSRRSLRDDHGAIQGRRSTQEAESMEISHILDPITESSVSDPNIRLRPRDRLYSGGGGRRSFSCSRNMVSKPRRSLDAEFRGFVCKKCGESFRKLEAIEAHHFSRHAVTPLSEEDNSRKTVEMIFGINNLMESESSIFGHEIERVLRVDHMQSSLTRFEDYRAMVKLKASMKYPRCLADGNELLRFYGTTVACSIGTKTTSTGLCSSDKCGLCRILRHGFSSTKEEYSNGFRGVFTFSTSKSAFEFIKVDHGEKRDLIRKALILCRVIGGRVHKPLEKDFHEMATAQSSFDSVAAYADDITDSNIEELYSLNPRVLLPCFVVICNPSMPRSVLQPISTSHIGS